MKKTLLSLMIIGSLVGCDDDSINTDIVDSSFELTLLHINDHHSKLDATEKKAIKFNDLETYVDVGGFPRLVTKFNELSADKTNVLRLHAGDAMTGTMYYSLFRDELPDALMMNQVCFDAFALGNHEFDDGNEQLAHFIKTLTMGEDACGTEVLAANIVVDSGNPIEYLYQPYKIFTVSGTKVGVIGIDIASKTLASSSPSADTEFLDEVETSQKYINELRDEHGVEKVILLTHYTYKNDIAMAQKLTGVDVIVGGDSHTLLGNSNNFNALGYAPGGDYPTIVENIDGDKVCIVQAWENSQILGELNVTFNSDGSVQQCSGTPHLLLSDKFEKINEEAEANEYQYMDLTDEELASVQAYIAQSVELSIVTPDEVTTDKLQIFAEELNVKLEEIIGHSEAKLCNERIPGGNHASGDLCQAGSDEREFMNKHGSVMAHIVSKAFMQQSLRSDIAIQNSGGVRTSINSGKVSAGDAFNVLPFSNTLVNLDVTGQQIINTLEDAIDNVITNSSASGAFPSTANLRFDLDMNAEKGQRLTNVEARKRDETEWKAIDLEATYVVVTNDFIAKGGDRYDGFVPVYENDALREDTGLLYTDSLINYIKDLEEQGKTLEHPLAEDMPIQNFTPLND